MSKYTRTHILNQSPIYAGKKVVGYVKGDTFYKSIKGSAHMLRKPPAIALDVYSLEQAKRAHAERVQVTDTETGDIYRVLVKVFYEKGFKLNRGYGDQIALTLDCWTRTTRRNNGSGSNGAAQQAFLWGQK